jgi:preprotein translocase subunit YajC
MVEKNFPGSQIKKMNNKMTNSILEGDLVKVSGQVLKIENKEGELLISCSIKLTVDEERVAVISEVDVLVQNA